MSRKDAFAHRSRSSWTSGRNWVAKLWKMLWTVDASVVSSTEGGVAPSTNRRAASTTSPSQWPDARVWFTIRAHAAASAVGLHGSATPLTQASAPNMETKSVAPNSSGVAALGKLANENPFGTGRSSVATGVRTTSASGESDEFPLEHDAKTTANAKTTHWHFRRRHVFLT